MVRWLSINRPYAPQKDVVVGMLRMDTCTSRLASSIFSLYLFCNGTLRYPTRMQFNGNVACPMKFGSPNMSSSCTSKRSNARWQFLIVNSHVSFHTGLNPFSAAINKPQIQLQLKSIAVGEKNKSSLFTHPLPWSSV